MRATAVFIVTLFCLQAGMGFVSAMTPETITIDGDVAEWSSDSQMASDDNAVTYYSTWDDDNFYLAWTGTDWADSVQEQIYSFTSIPAKADQSSAKIGVFPIPCPSLLIMALR